MFVCQPRITRPIRDSPRPSAAAPCPCRADPPAYSVKEGEGRGAFQTSPRRRRIQIGGGVRGRPTSQTSNSTPQSSKSTHRFLGGTEFSRRAQRSLILRPGYSPTSFRGLYIKDFNGFVTATAAPIATGWSDSCRVGLTPTEDRRLVTAYGTPYLIIRFFWFWVSCSAYRTTARGNRGRGNRGREIGDSHLFTD